MLTINVRFLLKPLENFFSSDGCLLGTNQLILTGFAVIFIRIISARVSVPQVLEMMSHSNGIRLDLLPFYSNDHDMRFQVTL